MKSFTNKETEINKAIIEWIKNLGFDKSYNSLLEETRISPDDIPKTKVLDKKWNTILLMQKKINDLELELKSVKEEVEFSKVNGISYGNKQNIDIQMVGYINLCLLQGLPKLPEKKTLSGHRQPVTCVTFHPFFNILSSCAEDGNIAIWEFNDYEIKQEQFVRAHTNFINSICFDSTGKILASCSSDLSIKLWRFDNPIKCYKVLNGHDHSVSSIEFSPDSNILYSASRDKSIKIWEVSTGFCKSTLNGHSEWVRSISLNDKGTLLASSSDDETVIIWQTDQGIERYKLSGHENKIEKVLFVKNNQANDNIFTADYSSNDFSQKEDVQKYFEQLEKLNELNKKLADHNKLSKKIDKEYVITCSRDKTIKLFDLFSELCIYTFTGHDNWVRDITIHPTGKYLISTGDDRSIRLWDIKTGRCVKKLDKVHDKFIVTISTSQKLGYIVSGSNDLTIKVFDCK